jgi:predicted transposase/invertase (TIGR01784 family)
MDNHDSSYRNFFSHARMVKDLLRGFVHEAWVDQLDFDTLELVNANLVGDKLDRREDDVVWRLRYQGEWFYIYLLMEFQSQPDQSMALRMMVYVGLLYQQLQKCGLLKPGDPLPPVFPLVLYNGTRPWNGSCELSDLLIPAPGELKRYQPSMRYLLIDESNYADLSEPAEQGNLAAALIQLENSRTPEDLRRVIRLLLHWLHAPEQAGLRRAFTVWLGRVLLPGKLKGIKLPELNELEEVDAMLAERVKEWTRDWEQQGMQKGMQKGEVLFLQRQLVRKYGPLPPVLEQRIQQAEPEQLFQWGERLLFAESLSQVFDD